MELYGTTSRHLAEVAVTLTDVVMESDDSGGFRPRAGAAKVTTTSDDGGTATETVDLSSNT